MQIEATGMFVVMLASLAVAIAPAAAQPAARALEHVSTPSSQVSSVVEPSPPPSAAQPPSPSHNVISQPQVCRIRTDSECFQITSACLTARGVSGLYGVDWRAGRPAVVRARDDLSEAQEKHARACATDLQQCLSGNC